MKEIAALLARAGIDDLFGTAKGAAATAERDEPKEMDVVAVHALLCTLWLAHLPIEQLCTQCYVGGLTTSCRGLRDCIIVETLYLLF